MATPDDVEETRVINGQPVTLNQQGWWAHAFYAFRSSTVHGQELVPEAYTYNGRSHFDLASTAFRIMVRQQLQKMDVLAMPLGIVGLSLLLEHLQNPPADD
jgi:hypothetical protein